MPSGDSRRGTKSHGAGSQISNPKHLRPLNHKAHPSDIKTEYAASSNDVSGNDLKTLDIRNSKGGLPMLKEHKLKASDAKHKTNPRENTEIDSTSI